MSELEAITMLYDGLEEQAYYAGRVDAEIAKHKEEIATLKELLVEVNKLLEAVTVSCDEICCNDVNKANWFDLRESYYAKLREALLK